MFDSTYSPVSGAVPALTRFMVRHEEALTASAALLGGGSAARRTQLLIADLSATPKLSRRLCRELVALHRLLSLRDVHDPEREEAGFFAAINLESSAVEEICLLTDRLREHLCAVAEAHDGFRLFQKLAEAD